MRIYTKKGDSGQTSLLSGERVKKSHPIINVVGDLDELSVALGLAGLANPDHVHFIGGIQKHLYQLSAIISYGSDSQRPDRYGLEEGALEKIENLIDDLESSLPPLTDFIFPGGSEPSCRLHAARVVTRRAERGTSDLSENVQNIVVPYLNRLSDLLFVMARAADLKIGQEEVQLRAGGREASESIRK